MELWLTSSTGKTHEQNFVGNKLGSKLGFLPFFQGYIISFPWCCSRLEQCLTSRRAETSEKKKKKKKKKSGPNWDQSDLFYSNVVEHPLKLAC